MIPLFFDCDPGIDDAVALGYLCCQHDVAVTGVAASGGNVPTAQTVQNALSWLALTGRPEIPVHPGADMPLRFAAPSAEAAAELPAPVYADDTHGPQGTGHAVLPQRAGAEEGSASSSVSAAQAWVDAARAHPGELIGVVTGPCTNLALALEIEPELPQLLKRVFIMGGAFNYRGNTKPTTEWNTDFDPEAAAEVYTAFVTAEHPPVVAPLEATETIVMTPDRLDRIIAGASDPQWRRWLEHLAEALRFYFEFHEWDGHGYLAQIHDPYVLAAALCWAKSVPSAGGPRSALGRLAPTITPEAEACPAASPRASQHVPWAETAITSIDVELTGTLTRGETVADWLGRWSREPNAELIRSIDAEGFLDHLETTLMRGPNYDHAR